MDTKRLQNNYHCFSTLPFKVLCRHIYGLKNVAVFTEIRREHSDIAGIGMIGDNLDFFAKVNRNRDPRKHGEQIAATQPCLTVTEIKVAETVRALSSATQLIAQLF